MTESNTLLQKLKHIYFIRGLSGVFFGLLILLLPDITTTFVIFLFGVNSLLVALFSFRKMVWNQLNSHPGGFYLVEAILALLIGVTSLFYANILVVTIVYLFGVWSFILGVYKIFLAVSYRGKLSGVIWLVIAGWAYFLSGVYLLADPQNGVSIIIAVLGLLSIFSGINLLILSRKLKAAT